MSGVLWRIISNSRARQIASLVKSFSVEKQWLLGNTDLHMNKSSWELNPGEEQISFRNSCVAFLGH